MDENHIINFGTDFNKSGSFIYVVDDWWTNIQNKKGISRFSSQKRKK